MFCAVIPQTPVLAPTPSGTVADGTTLTLTCTTGSTLSSANYRLTTAGTAGIAQGTNAFTVTASLSMPAYSCEASDDGGTTWSAASADITPAGESIWSEYVSVVLSAQARV